MAQWVKNLLAKQETPETQVWSLGRGDPLEEGMATHSGILTWRIPWTEEPCALQSMGLQRVGHDWSDLACMCLFKYSGWDGAGMTPGQRLKGVEVGMHEIFGKGNSEANLKVLNSEVGAFSGCLRTERVSAWVERSDRWGRGKEGWWGRSRVWWLCASDRDRLLFLSSGRWEGQRRLVTEEGCSYMIRLQQVNQPVGQIWSCNCDWSCMTGKS